MPTDDGLVFVSGEPTRYYICQDTREQKPLFESAITMKLDCCDYSICHYEGDRVVALDHVLAIERKFSGRELISNISTNRKRFERQLAKMQPAQFKFLVCEFGAHEFFMPIDSGVNQRYIACAFIDLVMKFNITPIFCGSRDLTKIMVKTLAERVVKHYL